MEIRAMENVIHNIENLNWSAITEEMHKHGYAVIPNLLTDLQCDLLKDGYNDSRLFRKTVVMEKHRFGLGEYKYFDYPLPELIQTIRSQLYPHLAVIANAWFRALKVDKSFSMKHEDLLTDCRLKGQEQATVLILKYSQGGFNTLHQDLYGAVYFPIQVVLMLNEPEVDFLGGEFVLTQQIPRAQSKAIVLKPKKGDLVLFATNFRPEKGRLGYFRVNMKHGVSEVTAGERHALGIIFHDAEK
ncbi:2OG-Fe(II) oxygenase [uncultured Sphingobacterium sp.]|jgi:hypothetical protein|uniref:2OG-Fe(II) oxygenase n=1 Tax=uncultured Sphingobacterium sp. TaxID=182688 RepID=UPI0037486669